MRLSNLIPLAVFVVISLALGVGLTLKPREIPSALIDQPLADFDLPPLEGRDKGDGGGLSRDDLATGEVALVNYFATWCGPCRVEHPLLMDVAKSGAVPIHAINHKDRQSAAVTWLRELGDPYTKVGADPAGRTGIDWGVYGLPETFVIDGRGNIKLKHVGPLSRRDLDEKVLPCVEKLQRDPDQTC